LGQVLTAMGSMLGRTARQTPEGSELRADLREISEIAQTTLDNVRGLSQTLHPSILEEAGLERTVDWYLSTIERQLGLAVSYERPASAIAVDSEIGIQVYRVLQESLSNIAKHAGVKQAIVRLGLSNGMLQLEVEDHGAGLAASPPRRGLGIIGMRERAALVGGTIEFLRPAGGGTLVRLCVPMVGAHV
jgi:two-component system sensor histidine kinase UhpB